MNRLLILGGSVAQLSAIRAARKSGCHVIVADRNPAAPGAAEADEFVRASTFDVSEIVAAAEATRPDGVLVVATDQPVLIASRACAEIGLPYPVDPEVALIATNKGRMKERLAASGIPTPVFSLIGPTGSELPGHRRLAALSPPIVVKPVDNQGQRGVVRCESYSDVPPAVERARTFSREETVLVEEFYPSNEVTVSGWVTGGTPQILTVTDRVTVAHGTSLGVCAAHRYPSTYARGHAEEIAALTQAVSTAIGITRGPIYFQMLCGDQGVKVNEVACRIGGAFEDQSLPLVTGVNLLERAIAESLGGEPAALPDDGSGHVPTTGAFSVPLLYCEPGSIAQLSDPEPVRRIGGIHAFEWLQPIGREIHQMHDSSQRAGYAVVCGAATAEVNTSLRRLFAQLSVTATDGREMLMDTLALCLHPE